LAPEEETLDGILGGTKGGVSGAPAISLVPPVWVEVKFVEGEAVKGGSVGGKGVEGKSGEEEFVEGE